MRDNGPITNTEIPLPEDALLVSQTDPGGRITFANDAFVEVSGFSREELLGAPDSIVIHPHMPEEAFRDLSRTVKAGRPWEGLVKNRTKNGDFYWVRTNVTPVVEASELKGFISIRTCPARADVAAAERVYAALRERRARNLRIEGGAVVRTGLAALWRRIIHGIASSTALILAMVFIAVIASLSAGAAGVGAGPRASGLSVVGALIVVWAIVSTRRMRRSFRQMERQFAALARGDLRSIIEPVPVHELQEISGFLRMLRAKLAYAEEVRVQREGEVEAQRVVAIREMADKVEAKANETARHVDLAAADIVTSASEMAEAAGSASLNAETAASAASEAMSSAQTVAATTEELAGSIREIGSQVTHATSVTREAVDESQAARKTITQLDLEVERIGHITSLIAEIASQTNLLALNATIEAARAGDAGKGFAVVAAEVKKLAAQTAKATGDISNQIAEIQRATTETVGAVTRIGGKVAEMDEVSTAIAAAMEQQSAATQEISRSVGTAAIAARTVTEVMGAVVEMAARTKERAGHLCARADELGERTGESRQSLIHAVRTSVTDAERRVYARVGMDEPATLVVGGGHHQVRLVDISQGGARVRTPAACSVEVGAACDLSAPGLGRACSCTVVNVDAKGVVSLAFGAGTELAPSLVSRSVRAA
jgi:PAS domain S-box-containing protein